MCAQEAKRCRRFRKKNRMPRLPYIAFDFSFFLRSGVFKHPLIRRLLKCVLSAVILKKIIPARIPTRCCCDVQRNLRCGKTKLFRKVFFTPKTENLMLKKTAYLSAPRTHAEDFLTQRAKFRSALMPKVQKEIHAEHQKLPRNIFPAENKNF